MLKTIVKIAMIATSVGEPVATVTRNARPVVMSDPMYGMNPPKNASTASGRASGIPRTIMIRNWVAAPKTEIAPRADHVAAEDAERATRRASTWVRRPGSRRPRNPPEAVAVAQEVERQQHPGAG